MRVVKSNNRQLTTLPQPYVKGLEKLEVENRLTKDVDRETVIQAHHDFHGALEPPELNALCLLLRYKNETGVPFFTSYKRVNGSDVNELSRFRKRSAG